MLLNLGAQRSELSSDEREMLLLKENVSAAISSKKAISTISCTKCWNKIRKIHF